MPRPRAELGQALCGARGPQTSAQDLLQMLPVALSVQPRDWGRRCPVELLSGRVLGRFRVVVRLLLVALLVQPRD